VTWVCSRYGLGRPFALGQKDAPNLLFGADHGQIGSNANSGGGGIRENAARTTLAYNSGADHSLHCGLSAPPTASQAFVPGVVRETQACFNS